MTELEQTAIDRADTFDRPRSRYTLVVLAAKRAKQLKEGAPFLIDTGSTNLLTVALEEIAAGKIGSIEVEEELDDEALGLTGRIGLPPILSEHEDLSYEPSVSSLNGSSDPDSDSADVPDFGSLSGSGSDAGSDTEE